jgi:putative transposase
MIQASEAQVEKLLNRRFDDLDLLIIYVDGMHFGDQCVIGAVGVDAQGNKHVLGIQEGAAENAAAAKDLLQSLVERGVNPERRRLFVIDGSKALRTAINAVFGSAGLVQRCRQHKLRNVIERLPQDQQEQTKSLMRAAGSWMPRWVWRSWKSWRNGCNESIPTQRTACGKAWKNVSPSIGWMCRPRCIAAWPARI